MENRDILIDSSIIIDFLRKRDKQKTLLWKLKEKNRRGFISAITVFELYAGAITKKHYEDLDRLLKWYEIVSFSEEIAKVSGEIYKKLKLQNKLIEFRDIFIGATALILEIPIITLNEDHFRRIEGIKIIKKENI